MQVKSIMTTNIISVKSIMPAHTVFGLIAQHRVHAVPVMDEAYELVGIIAEGDFFYGQIAATSVANYLSVKEKSGFKRLFGGGNEKRREDMTAQDIMTTPCLTISQEADMLEAAKMMVEKNISTLPVLNEHGTLVGVVTMYDVLKAMISQ